MRCDPPARHVTVLYDLQSFHHLPPLVGVARQPYFRELDGELIRQPGVRQDHAALRRVRCAAIL